MMPKQVIISHKYAIVKLFSGLCCNETIQPAHDVGRVTYKDFT